VRHAQALPVVCVVQRTTISALNNVVSNHTVAAGMGSSALQAVVNPFTTPTSPAAYCKAPSPMLRREQLCISLLAPGLGCPGIVDGQERPAGSQCHHRAPACFPFQHLIASQIAA